MTMKLIYRRLSPRAFALSAILITVLLCVYYSSYTTPENSGGVPQNGDGVPQAASLVNNNMLVNLTGLHANPSVERNVRTAANKNTLITQDTLIEMCPKLDTAEVDIDTFEVFREFDFQPSWMKNKEYWDRSFEDRWRAQSQNKALNKKFPLKVIIVPHSHNDPGWLKTYEQYFYYESKEILNFMVKKLNQYPNMTFIWSEISFLSMWWEQAHPTKRKLLKRYVDEGRLEITTGGWVMTDEATSHLYAMVDQLVEGHQWLLQKLDYKPKSGWSIDPFGHGSTVPYLLSSSGITGTVIQRIHYAWKQWLAKNRFGDFYWTPQWKSHPTSPPHGEILTHNQPFDIYSIKHSCGPHPYICLHFDFRKVVGEYTEHSAKAVEIDSSNIDRKSKTLVGEYSRTGSLFPHNVVLMPLGDDFRYNVELEWDQQYTNYKKIMDYVNNHKVDFDNTEIVFGTVKDYFEEIVKRYTKFPKLKGDFFVYSDIFSEGRPAYWSGYFTTRPFVKLLDRQLEHNLRNAEILYTVALNKARKYNLEGSLKIFDRKYEKLILARRNLGLFQHHDAITGTSKFHVMKDYSQKLFDSIQDMLSVQQDTIQSLLFNNSIGIPEQTGVNIGATNNRYSILSDLEYESNDRHPRKIPIVLDSTRKRFVVFNSLGQELDRVITIKSTSLYVKVMDSNSKLLQFQINPVWNASDPNNLQILPHEFEVSFIAKLPAFSLTTFYLEAIDRETEEESLKSHLAVVYCDTCQLETPATADAKPKRKPSPFVIKNTQPGDIQLETHRLRLLIDGTTGFLKSVTQKATQKTVHCQLQFSAYPSAQFHSGAYLFMPDPNSRDAEINVLDPYKNEKTILITSGPISSELSVMYGPFLIHTIRIYHKPDSILSSGIYIENEVDFEKPPKNRETEFFMRLQTEIQNGETPVFYTDLNGFQMQKRVKVEAIGIEGNYFPITTMAYIEDQNVRVSLLTNHAQGAAAWQPGQLEVMLERRSLYDDSRGMGEGLVDNVRTTTQYWLLVEDIYTLQRDINRNNEDKVIKDYIRTFNMDKSSNAEQSIDKFSRGSLYANTISNTLIYPLNIFLIEDPQPPIKSVQLLSKFPCDTHLVNFRTLPDPNFTHFPANNALMILHRQGHDCTIGVQNLLCDSYSFDGKTLSDLNVQTVQKTTLTGLHPEGYVTNMTNFLIDPMSLATLHIVFEHEKGKKK